MGISTGFKGLDRTTYGIQPGELWILAGRPASFKTWFLCNMFVHAGRVLEGPLLFFSKEMTREAIKNRVMALVGRTTFDLLRRYKLDDERVELIAERIRGMAGDMIIIGRDIRWNYDVSYIQSKVLEYEPKIAFVDGLYLMAEGTEWKDQTGFTRSLRDVGLMTDVPIVGTTQMKRGGKKMSLDNIMYSDSFAQDASVLLGMERVMDEVNERPTNKVKVKELKVREAEDNRTFIVTIGFKTSTFVEGDVEDPDGDDWVVSAFGADE